MSYLEYLAAHSGFRTLIHNQCHLCSWTLQVTTAHSRTVQLVLPTTNHRWPVSLTGVIHVGFVAAECRCRKRDSSYFGFCPSPFLPPLTNIYLPIFRSAAPSGRLVYRRESAAARVMEWRVPIPLIAWMSPSLVSYVCCEVQVSVSGRFLVQRGPTQCGVSECDREASIMGKPGPITDCSVEKETPNAGQRALPHTAVQVLWYSRITMQRRFSHTIYTLYNAPKLTLKTPTLSTTCFGLFF
jgi:hypothetical protein